MSDLKGIRRRDARDWPVISRLGVKGRNYESTAAIEALQRVAGDRHELLALLDAEMADHGTCDREHAALVSQP